MSTRLPRRHVLHLGGLGALSLFHPPLLTGCSSSEKSRSHPGGDGGPEGGSSVLPPLEFDPSKSWWLQHNYGPVADERDAMDLEVVGAIPPELDGLYVRNGSNPKDADPGHWFLGDGMVHGVRIKDGKALWYKNRYLQTAQLNAAPSADAGVTIPDLTSITTSNVSVIHHAGRLLSLGEVGYPYEVSVEDLSTVGAYDFAGKLMTSMTAHPKLDPVTGEMLMFGYWFFEPYLTYHVVDKNGVLTRSEPIDLPAPVMMHDFQMTETKVIFMDLPIIFDMNMALDGKAFPFRWDAKNGARLGVMPRAGGSADIVWIDIDPCFIFHTFNAYDDENGNVVLEAVRYDELWADGPDDFDQSGLYQRYTLDLTQRTATLSKVDDRPVEFPQIDRRLMGRKHRYAYGLWLPEDRPNGNIPAGIRGFYKFDRQADTTKALELDSALQPDEAFFVPASPDSGEDDGYLFSYVYDRRTDRTSLFIIDASTLAGPPIAEIKLPFRVPFGFHGVWVPASAG